MGAPDPGEHGRDVPIARVQRFAELAIAPANPREAPLQRRDGNRLLSAPAVDAGGEIEPDGLRIRGEGVKPLAAQPGGKLSPIGVVSALGVFGARVAGVIAGLFAERREMRRGVPLRDGRRFLPTWALGGLTNSDLILVNSDPASLTIVPHESHYGAPNSGASLRDQGRQSWTLADFAAKQSGHSSGVLAAKIRRLERPSTDQTRIFARHCWRSESCPISPHYRTSIAHDKRGGFLVKHGDKAPPWVMLGHGPIRARRPLR